MQVTIKQIAEETGLSNQTVSFVLGSRAHLFRPETCRRVRDAAVRLGYRPNASARAMRAGRFNSIALLLSTEGSRSSLLAGFLEGVEQALHETGQHLVVTAMPDRKLTDQTFVPQILRESMSDGLLVNYFREIPSAMADLIAGNRVPAIWTNTKREADCVCPDDFDAGLRATEHLLALGHRRIAYVDCGDLFDRKHDHYSVFDRCKGYVQAMRAAGLAPQRFTPGHNRLRGREIVEAVAPWLASSERPTATVTYGDREVFGLREALAAMPSKVSRKLALATFVDAPLLEGMLPVTTLMIPTREMGTAAVKMLQTKIANPEERLAPRALKFEIMPGAGTLR